MLFGHKVLNERMKVVLNGCRAALLEIEVGYLGRYLFRELPQSAPETKKLGRNEFNQ